MNTFEPGEIAIYVRPGSPYFGMEVVITQGLHFDVGGYDILLGEMFYSGMTYTIVSPALSFAANKDWFANPEWLKKKPKPQREMDTQVSWDDCLWRPAEMEIVA